ncbi:MAG: hypothetical protein ACI4LB_06100 [Candidatus Fimenecus sp.]
MKQNILQIAVSAAPETAEDTLSAGKMYEHNATALVFTLEESLVLPEYRYYVEFVTVSGTARTEYLTPDAQNQITVDLPVEVTSQMTALCVFNIVQIAKNGKTEQVIKAKTVRLYFSALENTDRLIDENHAFSVNQLLEAIRQNTFKGEKGDKGDTYILTDADKTEIAQQVDRVFYGLPLQKHMTVYGTQQLHAATGNATVTELTVRPTKATFDGIDAVQVAIGKNIIADILDSSLYKNFKATVGNYAEIPLNVKRDTPYVLAKLRGGLTQGMYAYILVDTVRTWFCHNTLETSNFTYFPFTAHTDSKCTLNATYIYRSQDEYQKVLDNEWNGLTIMEQENSVILKQDFTEPLCAVSAEIGDSFDFISGTLTRRTAKAILTSAQLDADSTVTLTQTAYRYKLTLPEDSPRRLYGCAEGHCTVLPTMAVDAKDSAAYTAYVKETGQTEGIWLGSLDESIYIISETAPADFAAWLEAEMPEILYATVERTEARETAAVTLPKTDKDICISPKELCADIRFSADISAVANDFESRIARLENNI